MNTTSESIPFSRPSIGKEEEEAVLRVMRSGWLTTGSEAIAFEKEFAAFVASPHALAVNSATSGLQLALEACGVGQGTTVITTPYTFASTALAAEHLGARVVYADIEKDGYNIDPAQISRRLDECGTATVAALIPVHIAGRVCDMNAILDIARSSKIGKNRAPIKVVEDAAHAFPSKTADGFAGTLSDAGVFSFYATKTITTGEGGMVCVRDAELARRISTLRLHGIDRPVWYRYTSNKASWEYDVVEAGWKCNLPDILAAIGREQLKKAQQFFEERTRVVERYNAAFSRYDFLRLPPDGDGNAWHLYLLRIVPEKLHITRDEFASRLQEKGIGVSVHFIPHFRMTYFAKKYGLSAHDFPNAQRQFETTISLPLWPGMDGDVVDRVIDTVIELGTVNYAKHA